MIEGKGEPYGRHIAPTGEDKILAYSSAVVGDSQWFVAVSAPFSEVTLSVRKSLRFYSWVIIVILMAAGGATVMMIYLNRKREKAEVSAAHEKELEKYSAELEQKVESRTKELSNEKEKLNTIVSAVGSGILLIDKEGKILWINQTMRDVAGKDITGMFCEQICTDCAIVSSYEDHDIQTEILTNLFGFSNRFYQVITAPVKSEAGDVNAYIKLVQDVTEMKRMEEQMMHTEKLAAMERLTSGIANEIGNPLTSVFSFVQILLDMEEDEFKKETLDTIYSNMSRISEILAQLSDFSKMPSVEREPCRVNTIIADSLSLIQYDKRVQDIMIVRDLGTDMPEIITDGSKLSQVFVNILLNAVDAMENGGTLTIHSRVKDGNIVIDFEDTGAGTSSEDLKKIFDPFHATKGTGIGLAVSQKIIRQLNGSLTAESEVGKGSRFEVTLPIRNMD
jgi:C4-dicarboxylate-specific signal transduction histidine kinase